MTTESQSTSACGETAGVGTWDLLAVWPEDRRKELAELQELLREIKSVNHGSNALGRIARCIEIAEKLTDLDMETCRPDFFSFLVNQAVTRHPANDPVRQPGQPQPQSE